MDEEKVEKPERGDGMVIAQKKDGDPQPYPTKPHSVSSSNRQSQP